MNNTTPSDSIFKLTTDLITIYGIPGISVIGTALNLCSAAVLLNAKLKHSFYDFLFCRTICNLLVCLFGIFYSDLVCEKECTDSFVHLNIHWFGLIFPKRVALLASFNSDILIILNRMLTVYDRKDYRFILKMPKWVSIFFCFYSLFNCYRIRILFIKVRNF